MWPGCLGYARYTYANPRWEDFQYEMLDDLDDNPMGWLGNGLTLAIIQGGYLTDHLDDVDIPPIINKVVENLEAAEVESSKKVGL